MQHSVKPQLLPAVDVAFSEAYSRHGDLGLGAVEFADRLAAVVEKLSAPGASSYESDALLRRLNTSDLYLVFACAMPSEEAWMRFRTLYRKFMYDLARSVCPNPDAAREVADGVLADLFLHDRLGRSRIASYDGRSTLATWLRAVVTNRAINERERRFNNLDCLENVSEPADRSYATRFEAAMRATRYEAMIRDSFQIASRELTERESLILILRYDDMLQAVDIASFLGVHPSTITRSLQQTHRKLRRSVETILNTKYGLGQAAIEECFEHIVETPGHSILAYVKTGCPSYTGIGTVSLPQHRL